MDHKRFRIEGIEDEFVATLAGETRRTVKIAQAGQAEPPLVVLDPVSHDVAHQMQTVADDEFIDRAIAQVRAERLIEKARQSDGGPVIALLHP